MVLITKTEDESAERWTIVRLEQKAYKIRCTTEHRQNHMALYANAAVVQDTGHFMGEAFLKQGIEVNAGYCQRGEQLPSCDWNRLV
jgi:hypothetical protein